MRTARQTKYILRWALGIAAAVVLGAVAEADGTTVLLSVNSSATASANSYSQVSAISADGQVVVFTSVATDLVDGFVDGNGAAGNDLFVRDVMAGTTTLVSVNNLGTASGNGTVYAPLNGPNGLRGPGISADGRFVVFAGPASDLVPGDANGFFGSDVFVRDLMAGTTTLVSVNSTGTSSGNNSSEEPSMTPDGRFVVFRSFATDLVEGVVDPNGAFDIFVRDLIAGTTTLVSVNSAGTATGNDDSGTFPAISDDGRFVAFGSDASDLVPGFVDANGQFSGDLFVRDLTAGTTALVTRNHTGTAGGNGGTDVPVISRDGRLVAFVSGATDLVAGFVDGNGEGGRDVFVHDVMTGSTTLVSVNGTGSASGNGNSQGPVFSANGRFVTFVSFADDLVAIPTDPGNVYVRDLQTGTTELVSANSAGTGVGDGSSSNPVPSADGRVIAFQSGASNLVEDVTDTNFFDDVFVRDLNAGVTSWVSISRVGTAGGNDQSLYPVISADGRFVAFESESTDLVADFVDGNDTFERDVFRFSVVAPATRTPTPSPPVTAPPTPTQTATSAPSSNATTTATSVPNPTVCTGDCNGNSEVTVNELLTMVNIALGNAAASACAAGDTNADGQVTVSEIVTAVGRALSVCPT